MKLKLVVYPHDALRKKADVVHDFNASLKNGLHQMEKILDKQKGVGLAAPQVDWNVQCFLVKYENTVHTFINPQLLHVGKEMVTYQEGCLSIPGVYADVTRPKLLRIRAQNQQGDFFEIESDSFFARIIFHEYDHLQGILFVDHLPKNMCSRILKEYQSLQK